jgi:hypothetical protein
MEFMKQFRSDKLTTAHALVASWFLGYFLIKQKVTKAVCIEDYDRPEAFYSGMQ